LLLIPQAKDERNFHVFYRLLAGCSDAERTVLGLTRAEDYTFLTAGDCISLPGMDDGEEWQRIRGAMKVRSPFCCAELTERCSCSTRRSR
jgi:myosin heavy subunit